jgi:hypothetical protein
MEAFFRKHTFVSPWHYLGSLPVEGLDRFDTNYVAETLWTKTVFLVKAD